MKIPARIVGGTLAGALAIASGLVVKWEGTRYHAYQDPIGVWTICEGHTRGIKAGDTATPEQCAQYREQDMLEAATSVARCIYAPMTEGQFAALVDATYNLGPRVVCGSTLQRKANAGDMPGACAELARWINAGGRPMRGLVLRRSDERAMCWPDFSNVRSDAASTSRIAT